VPKFAKGKIRRILAEYAQTPVFKTVADKLDVDQRAVPNIVGKQEQADNAVANLEAPTAQHDSIKLASQMAPDEKNKVIYTEFLAGRKCAEIIAKYGFSFEEVDKEWHRFCKLNDTLPISLQRALLAKADPTNNDSIRKYVSWLSTNGYLTNLQIVTLIDEIIELKVKETVQNVITGISSSMVPSGYHHAKCSYCGTVFGIVQTPSNLLPSGTTLFWKCPRCDRFREQQTLQQVNALATANQQLQQRQTYWPFMG
jgi:hypothetical protein